MRNKLVNLLVFLIKTESKQCPPEDLFPVSENRLLILASRNKTTPFLFHFLNCPSCKKRLTKKTIRKLSQYRKFALIWPLLYQKEKQLLGKLCRQEKIRAVLLKDFSSYPKILSHQQFQMAVDLDLLVRKKELPKIESFLLKKGYQVKENLRFKNGQGKIYYQEKTFAHPKKHVSLDLHTQLAIPHHDEFLFLNPKLIAQISKAIYLNSHRRTQDFLFEPGKEYFLFSLIIHYLGSDLLKGLRNLFDIIQFAHFYDEEIGWEKFWALAQQYKITNFSSFIFLLGSHVFDRPIPRGFKRNIHVPFRVKFLIPYYFIKKIAIFPSIVKWNKKNKEARKIFYENFFIKMLLADSVSSWRLIRPRVFFFVLRVGCSWLNKSVSRLYRKSL